MKWRRDYIYIWRGGFARGCACERGKRTCVKDVQFVRERIYRKEYTVYGLFMQFLSVNFDIEGTIREKRVFEQVTTFWTPSKWQR